MRTPRSPVDENVSAERGTLVAAIGASGMDHVGADPVRNGAVGIGQLDLEPVGAGGLARGLGDETHLAARGLAGDEPHLRAVADLDAGEPALGHLDHRQHRIERNDRCRSPRPAMEKAALPTSTMVSLTTPAQGARTTPRSSSASAEASAAFAALSCDCRLTRSSFGLAPLAIRGRLASSSALRCITSDLACATWDSRASSDRTRSRRPP